MKPTRYIAPLLALAMTASTAMAVGQNYGPPPPPPGYGQGGGGGWENAPQEFREIQQRGFHDGIEGARKDFQNHRPPNVNNRDEYRHPGVSGPDRHDYRESFRRGYQVGVQHIYGRGPRY